MLDICRRSSCAGRMDRIMRDLLEAKLPPDAAQRCSGRFFAGVTVVDGGGPKSVMTWEGFKDRADLIETLAASTFIPIWSSNRLTTSWRGQETADGSLSAKQPCPPGVDYCLRIASRWPDLPRPTMPETFAAIARALSGRASSAAAMTKPELPELGAALKADKARVEAVKAAGVDIAPGLAIKRDGKWDAATWTEVRRVCVGGGAGPAASSAAAEGACTWRRLGRGRRSAPMFQFLFQSALLVLPRAHAYLQPHHHPKHTLRTKRNKRQQHSSASSRATSRRATGSTAWASSTRWRGPTRPASRTRR